MKAMPERTRIPGRHFLQIPGPSNVPDEVLRAIDQPTIDHRGPEFAELTLGLLEKIKWVFQTESKVVVYPSSGTGAWEAALSNLVDPGGKVLAYETGHFANLWRGVAERMGLEVNWIESDWRSGIDAGKIEEALSEDKDHEIKAVMAVHGETSNGVNSNILKVREAIDSAGHPALLLVDVVSSLATADYRHDAWGVDVAIAASQKGLMLPPGLGFNAISQKAILVSKECQSNRSYWDWRKILESNETGYYPYTPASNMLFGLDKALDLLQQEGFSNLFSRHNQLAEATRAAVDHWGLENVCTNKDEFAASTTAIYLPEEFNADKLRQGILEKYNLSLGTGLGKFKGRVFRVGHLGDINALTVLGTLAGVEMGLVDFGVPIKKGGVEAAMAKIQA